MVKYAYGAYQGSETVTNIIVKNNCKCKTKDMLEARLHLIAH